MRPGNGTIIVEHLGTISGGVVVSQGIGGSSAPHG